MRKIFKYELDTSKTFTCNILIPTISLNNGKVAAFKDQVLKIDIQNGIPCIWCLVDVNKNGDAKHGYESREIVIELTGINMSYEDITKDEYLGTYFYKEYVHHVFILNKRDIY